MGTERRESCLVSKIQKKSKCLLYVCQDHVPTFTEHLLHLCVRIVYPGTSGFGVMPKQPKKMVYINERRKDVVLDNE